MGLNILTNKVSSSNQDNIAVNPMNIFLVIVLALCPSETNAQLSTISRRLRVVDARQHKEAVQQLQQEKQEIVVDQVVPFEQEERDLKKDKEEKQTDEKKGEKQNNRDKKKKNSASRNEMSMPANLCASQSKNKCKSIDACIWDGGLCSEVPEDLCAPLSKKLCKRYDTCDWDGSTCSGANRRGLVSPTGQRRLGDNNKINTSNSQTSCASLGRKRCKNSNTCTWNSADELCFMNVAPEMSMPSDQCASLGKKKCKRNDTCTWDGSHCVTTPEDVCASLTKKQCKNDDACTWDGSNCFGA